MFKLHLSKGFTAMSQGQIKQIILLDAFHAALKNKLTKKWDYWITYDISTYTDLNASLKYDKCVLSTFLFPSFWTTGAILPSTQCQGVQFDLMF